MITKQGLMRILGGLLAVGIAACVFIVIGTAAAAWQWLSQ